MKTRSLTASLRWSAALLLPALLILLFKFLKGSKPLMDRWVSSFMAPVEQFLGRVWSLLPWFSAAEVLTALFLVGSAAWLIRAVVLLVRDRAGRTFLRRLLAFVSALLWLWAAVSWMWNAAYYASSFQGEERDPSGALLGGDPGPGDRPLRPAGGGVLHSGGAG